MRKIKAMCVAMVLLACGTGLYANGQQESQTTGTTAARSPIEAKGEVGVTPETLKAFEEYVPMKTSYKFVMIPKLVHEWYEDVKSGAQDAIGELKASGVDVALNWDAPSDAVVTLQINKMEAAASSQPDGISVAIIDPSAETSVINELIDNGIKVSTFDCDAPDSERLYYCGHSTNYQDGYDIAKVLGDALHGQGQIAVLAGTLSASNHIDRVKGFKDCIKKNYPEITIVDTQADNDSVETALSITEGYLSTYPNLVGIFGCNGAAPDGAARAVKDAGKAGKVLIVGMVEDSEGLGYVKDGTILCTLKQCVKAYGYCSIYNMVRLADGQQPVRTNDELAASFVTKDNIAKFI
jgi:ribose transport system substrate-binding protein